MPSTQTILSQRKVVGKGTEGLIANVKEEKEAKVEVCLVEEDKGKEGEELTLPVWEEKIIGAVSYTHLTLPTKA